MSQQYKSIRATIEGEQLIERYEKYKFDNELTDREIISTALREYLENERENEQCL